MRSHPASAALLLNAHE